MGHFENGRWIENPFDGFVDSMVNISSAFSNLGNNLLYQLIEWNDNSGVFRKGALMKRTDLMAEWWQMNSSEIPNSSNEVEL